MTDSADDPLALVAFLRARLDEDEQWALAASAPYPHADGSPTVPPGGVHWTWVVSDNWEPVKPDPTIDDTVGGPDNYGCSVHLISVETWPSGHRSMPAQVADSMVEVLSGPAGHIVRHDPARVLREVEAKRRILGLHDVRSERSEVEGRTYASVWCATCNEPGWCQTLCLLALPYADQPGYQEGWKP